MEMDKDQKKMFDALASFGMKQYSEKSEMSMNDLMLIHETIPKYLFFDEPGNGVMMRHDVDDKLDMSMKLAEIQNKNGWKATYFILNTAPYWTKDKDLWKKLNAMIEMGHRVEWHNDCITDSVASLKKKTPKECAAEILQMFRDNGIAVSGSASHGNSLCHKLNYINYMCFSECQEFSGKLENSKGYNYLPNNSQPFHMYELILQWEAYHVQHDLYFSEPGGNWKNKPDLFKIAKNDSRTQILIHPQWWEFLK